MQRIAIVTDSNSGITQADAPGLGLHVLPMPFTMDGEGFFEDINLTQETFYAKLDAGAAISTSQPSLGALLDLWNQLLETHDEVVIKLSVPSERDKVHKRRSIFSLK